MCLCESMKYSPMDVVRSITTIQIDSSVQVEVTMN